MFLSDIHLGTLGSQADLLLVFLKLHDAETIYLVGDIIDGWRLRKFWFWPQCHIDVVQALLDKARAGARVIYIPGNHDEFLRDFLGMHSGGVEVMDQCIHEGANKKKYLVTHGDQFDVVVSHARWLAFFGDWAYVTALKLNTVINYCRRKMGLTYWSFAAWAKQKVKKAVNAVGKYEKTLVFEARRQNVQGVICGHVHHAASHETNGIHYINTGDWVESCTAITESFDGTYEVIRWGGSTKLSDATGALTDGQQVAA
ncbi:UDP-2,3-diacylglucosamine diphosphatase (plasmid) [Pseudovibrio brasiliensis]|uniref:UDP-2,3-diacylglucosamine diphosphatase n=1 Tax=Pseudovibrio brasiliensis TaxID=1898042 RepID=A0ABX8AVU3_9HYPH|nr:UDP-2,3-diacylglucosamine diphosphatase [Pseudovibrio brasiliensis]